MHHEYNMGGYSCGHLQAAGSKQICQVLALSLQAPMATFSVAELLPQQTQLEATEQAQVLPL
jgi:hypothetical protein